MIPAFIVTSSMSDSLFLIIVEVDVDPFNGSKDSILTSFFFSDSVLFVTFRQIYHKNCWFPLLLLDICDKTPSVPERED